MNVVDNVEDGGPAVIGAGTIVIEPRPGWRSLGIREMFEYRDLFRFLVHRSIQTRYAQSALGLAWAVIQPIATMVVFTLVFGKMVKVSSDGVPYPIFSLVGLAPWLYFQAALTEATQTLIAEKNTISKIYFPRMILPVSRVVARLVDFGVVMGLVVVMLLIYHRTPNLGALMVPPLVLAMVLAAAGIGMLFSAMAVQYRDVSYGMTFMVRLLMYSAPVVYPASLVPERYRILYGLNPMVGVIEGFRSGLLGTNPMPWDLIVPGLCGSLVAFLVGAAYFRRKERIFADVA